MNSQLRKRKQSVSKTMLMVMAMIQGGFPGSVNGT